MASKNCGRLYDGLTHNEMLEFYRVVVQSCQLIESENMWNRTIGSKLRWIGVAGGSCRCELE